MRICISFDDGTPMYVRENMTTNEFTEELEAWNRLGKLEPVFIFGTSYGYKMCERTRMNA